jgi:CheY-like chemotaxis protein
MSIKHALVVDDSKAARVALKRLLERYELVVDLAETGEEALRFLEHRTADVIFMDHTMPGMDGLQAVAAIKSNPRTAMIPVMMYTTQEGEVYVGQARALGAIGVLPKAVQPQVLFDMLLGLGLVRDKRTGAPAPDGVPRDRRATDPGHRAPPDVAGLPIEGLVRRVLEDQQELRAELLENQRTFAKNVADEIVEAQRAAVTPPASTRSQMRWQIVAGVLALATLGLGAALVATRDTRSPAETSASLDSEAANRVRDLETAIHTQQTDARAHTLALLDALQWAMNRNASAPYDALAFDDDRAQELETLLSRLVQVDFRGRVRVESHLGEFCLVDDDTGQLALATPDLPVEACTRTGHPLDDSSSVSERQSPAFAGMMSTSPLVTASGIEVELVAHDRDHSLRQVPFPPDTSRAGDWNRIAERNNRVEYTLIPTD